MNGKRYWASIIKRSLIAFSLIFLLGVTFDHLTNDSEYREPITAGFVALIIYLFAILVLSVVHFISNGLYLWWFRGSDMVQGILDELRQMRIPAPNEYEPKNFDYIQMLADDEEAEANDRVKAGVFLGAYNLAMSNGIFSALVLRRALDDAVLRYAQEAPRKLKSAKPKSSDFEDGDLS